MSPLKQHRHHIRVDAGGIHSRLVGRVRLDATPAGLWGIPAPIRLRATAGLSDEEVTRIVRAQLRQADPAARIQSAATLNTIVDSMISRERLVGWLSTVFGVLAAALAGIGLYGVMAYNLSRRRREIGIRMAVGARPGDVSWLALSESLRLAAVGALVGIPGALAAGRLVRSSLYGVRATDPWILATAVVSMVAIAMLSALLPATRAARIDPSSALRQE